MDSSGKPIPARMLQLSVWALLALLPAPPAAAQACTDRPDIRTDIEQVRGDCLGAVGALVSLESPERDADASLALDALRDCARSARLLGQCKDGQACVFSGVGTGPDLLQCGASPRRLSTVGREAVALWPPPTHTGAAPDRLDAQQRLRWNGFLLRLYGERCRSLSGCWAWLKSRALSSDPRDYRDQELAARIDQTGRRLEGMRSEFGQTLNAIWQGSSTEPFANGGLRALLQSGTGSLRSLATDVGALRVALETREPTVPDRPAQQPEAPKPTDTKSLADAIDKLANAVSELKRAGETPSLPAPKSQISPDDDYEKIFTQARGIGYGLLLVPDPRVPRHRRSYDLSIASTNQAMLAEDYVLDRYFMPWQDYLDNPAGKPAAVAPAAARYLDDGRFGVLLYRHDGWRNGAEGYDIRVLFVVAETASFGVQQQAFISAVARVLEKTVDASARPRQFMLAYPGELKPEPGYEAAQSLSIVGPAFSGSITSVVEALHQVDAAVLKRESECYDDAARAMKQAATGKNRPAQTQRGKENSTASPEEQSASQDQSCREQHLAAVAAQCQPQSPRCNGVRASLISPATTAASNGKLANLLAKTSASRFHIDYQRLAVSDESKLEALATLLPQENPDPQGKAAPPSVVLFAEASIFGNSLCPPDSALKICKSAVTIHFPANIADVRYGQNALDKAHRQQVQSSLKVAQDNSALALEDGAENGSEFPESQRSPLSTVSASATLDYSIEQARAYEPRLIIVAATDVRDRLFLFDRLRRQIPSAQLVDLETDVLMSHPSFIHASRGSLLLGSAFLCNFRDDSGTRLMNHASCGSLVPGAKPLNSAPSEPLVNFATDDQALLYAAIRGLCDPHLAPSCDATRAEEKLKPFRRQDRKPILHMPTQQGLAVIALSPDGERAWFIPVLRSLSPVLALLAIAALALLYPLLSPRRGASWLRRGSAIAAAIAVPGFCLYALCRVPPLQGNNTLLALSGVNPWLAAAIVTAAVGFVVLYALSTRLAYRLSAALASGEVLLPGASGNTMQRQNIIAPLDLTNGGFALPAIIALLLWLWLAISQPDWRHSLLLSWVEMTLTYAQPAIAFAAMAGLALSAAWAHCAMVSANRIAAMAQRLNGDGLPSWSVLPGFLVGTIASTPPDRLTRTLIAITGGQPELHVMPPAQRRGTFTTIRARPRFAATPLLARSRHFAWLDQALSGAEDASTPAAVQSKLERLCQLQSDFSDSLGQRALLALILARHVEAARYSLYFSLLMALALPLLVYSYPLAGGERYALFGLVLMLAGAFFSAFLLYRMQHLPALDRLLCNGEGKTKIEYQTLTALFSPLLMALLAWAVVKMPGVLDWSGGLLEVLLGVLKR